MSTCRQFFGSIRQFCGTHTRLLRIQRSFHSNALALKEQPTAEEFAKIASKKFVDQVRKGRESNINVEPTQIVQIDGLPQTATAGDIRKLVQEAMAEGDQMLNEIVFCRNATFEFTGRCIAFFNTPQAAQSLITYANRRLLGGHIIKLNFVGKSSTDIPEFIARLRRPELQSFTDSKSYCGRAVLFTGLPIKTLPEHVLGLLRSKQVYPVDDTSKSLQKLTIRKNATVAKYLVKFETESEAWRCVRIFHNMNFTLKTTSTSYRLQASVVY